MTTRLTFAATLPGPLADLTRDGRVRLEGYFVGRALLLRLAGADANPQRLAQALRAADAELEHADEAEGTSFLAHGALPERALCDAIERGGAVLPPLRWERGEVRVEALAFAPRLGEEVCAAFPQARVVRKAAAEEAPGELLRGSLALPGLTRKQAEAILAALDAGYYDAPRKVTTAEVAKLRGVARSTFEEHLKRAEGQFVAALAPLARLKVASDGAARAEAIALYARFSEVLGLYVTMALRGDKVTQVHLARRAPEGAKAEHPYLARVLEHLATGKGDLDGIPLDLEVSDFERSVLEEMRRIPSGEVMTYGDLARRLGKPGAARAVGNACAHNPAVIVVPCHRVVPSNGELGNYSGEGGAKTKEKLLALEGALPPKRRAKP